MAKRRSKKSNKVVTGVVLTLVAAGVVGGTAAITRGFTEAPKVGFIEQITSKDKIYSVEFENGKAKGKRMDAAVGLAAGINGERNDFDNVYPYSEMKMVTDIYGNKFIDIPKFYEKIDILEDGVRYSITGKETKGFHVAPMFIQGDKVVEHVQIGAYEASFANDGRDLASVAGEIPAGSITLDEARELAAHNGNSLFDWRQNQALQTLFSVEFATTDSQSVMRGNTEYICAFLEEQSETNKKKLTVSQDDQILFEDTKMKDILDRNPNVYIYYSGDDIMYIDTATLESYKINEDSLTSITLDKALNLEKIEAKVEEEGWDFDPSSLYFDINGIAKTGATDGLKGSSTGDPEQSIAMNYRGIENWYGSTWTWVDGIATIKEDGKDMICVSMDSANNGDRDSYKRIESGNIVNSVTTDGLYLADHSSEEEVNDYFGMNFITGEYRIGCVGGGCDGTSVAGAFSLRLGDDVSSAYYYSGFRLSYIPQ